MLPRETRLFNAFTIAVLISKSGNLANGISGFHGMGPYMARAFREGVEQNKRITTNVRRRNWSPLRDLRGLKTRTERIGEAMGPLVEIPAMVRIENEHWVFERIEEGVLHNLTHKLILHEEDGEKIIGATTDMETAMKVAKCMAIKEQRIIMIQPL